MKEPDFYRFDRDLRINIYRKDYIGVNYDTVPDSNDTIRETSLEYRMMIELDVKKIMDILNVNSSATQQEIAATIKKLLSTVKHVRSQLQTHGLISQVGSQRTGKWIVHQ